MLRLVFLVAVAAGSETFAHSGKMVVVNKYAAVGSCTNDSGQLGHGDTQVVGCLVGATATLITEPLCLIRNELSASAASADTLSDCKWTGCQDQTNTLLPADITSSRVPITAVHVANPGTTNAAGSVWQAEMKTIVVRKAFPLVTTAGANLHNGIYFKTAKMFNVGAPFAALLTGSSIDTGSNNTPVYGFFSLDVNSDVQFTSWVTAVPATNATAANRESLTGWNCQAAGNTLLGTGVISTKSNLAGVVLSGQHYITIDLYTGSTTCANTVIAPGEGGRTYEKVSWDAGSLTGQQTSCTQSGATSNGTSYAFTCGMGINGKPEITYTTYATNKCSGTATVVGKFSTSNTAPADTCMVNGSDGWKIMNPVADWDTICSSVHTGKMAQLQTQDVQANCSSAGSVAATPTNTNVIVRKLFPVSTATDSNFTGQYLKAGLTGGPYNVGFPFNAAIVPIVYANAGVYMMWIEAADGDLDLYQYEAMPPWQAFIPAAASVYYTQTNATTTAVSVFGLAISDAITANGGDGTYAEGYQCTEIGTEGAGSAGDANLSTGYAANATDFAITTGHKWITLRETNAAAGTSCAADRTYTTGALGGVTYEKVVAGTATAAVTPATGCMRVTASTSYTFKCTKNTAQDAWDIIYTPHTDAVCGTPSTVSGAILTFTKAAKCQITSTAAKAWEIQNTDADWDVICGTAPTPPSASASASASASGDATSDAAVAATAAALAAGAAALIL